MVVETKRQTVADFDALPEGAYAQLINGEIIMSSPAPSFQHQTIVGEIFAQMRAFVKSHSLGTVVVSPIDVYLTEDEVYEPDVVFIERSQNIVSKGKIKGTPTLVVEVLSPSNAYHDLVHKKNVYESSGVKEYWIVDPMEKTIEVLENRDGQFVTSMLAKKSGSIASNVLRGFSIALADVFPT